MCRVCFVSLKDFPIAIADLESSKIAIGDGLSSGLTLSTVARSV